MAMRYQCTMMIINQVIPLTLSLYCSPATSQARKRRRLLLSAQQIGVRSPDRPCDGVESEAAGLRRELESDRVRREIVFLQR